jgi:hypothetical protein
MYINNVKFYTLWWQLCSGLYHRQKITDVSRNLLPLSSGFVCRLLHVHYIYLVRSSIQISVNFYRTKRRYGPEESTPHTHRCETLRSCLNTLSCCMACIDLWWGSMHVLVSACAKPYWHGNDDINTKCEPWQICVKWLGKLMKRYDNGG